MADEESGPAFQWYPKDYLTSTPVMMMSLSQEGAYRRLLDYQWLNGWIPESVEEIARLCRVRTKEMEKIWPGVAPCFCLKEGGGGLVNLRLEREREKQRAYRERMNKAGRAGAQARWKGRDRTAEAGILECDRIAIEEPRQCDSMALQFAVCKETPLPPSPHNDEDGNTALKKKRSQADLDLAAKVYRCFINSRANAYEHLGMKTSGAPKLEGCIPLILAARDATLREYDDADERIIEAALHVAFDPYAMGQNPKYPGPHFSPKEVFKVTKGFNNIVKLSDAWRARPEDERDKRPEDLEDCRQAQLFREFKQKVDSYDSPSLSAGDHALSH